MQDDANDAVGTKPIVDVPYMAMANRRRRIDAQRSAGQEFRRISARQGGRHSAHVARGVAADHLLPTDLRECVAG